jgi:threonine dehydrogenase-like Zn-dependent dehydrogenase
VLDLCSSRTFIHLQLKVTDVFKIDDYQEALNKMNNRGALKIVIKP